jgi:hypothetical protein
LCKALVLAFPDFHKVFILETYACAFRLEAMLNQEGKPLAFVSKALSSQHLRLLIYKKEFMAILMAIDR